MTAAHSEGRQKPGLSVSMRGRLFIGIEHFSVGRSGRNPGSGYQSRERKNRAFGLESGASNWPCVYISGTDVHVREHTDGRPARTLGKVI